MFNEVAIPRNHVENHCLDSVATLDVVCVQMCLPDVEGGSSVCFSQTLRPLI